MATAEQRPPDERARDRAGEKRRRRPPWPDIVLAALLLLASAGVLLAVATGGSQGPGDAQTLPTTGPRTLWVVVAGLLLCCQTIPLAFRRRQPLLVFGL